MFTLIVTYFTSELCLTRRKTIRFAPNDGPREKNKNTRCPGEIISTGITKEDEILQDIKIIFCGIVMPN